MKNNFGTRKFFLYLKKMEKLKMWTYLHPRRGEAMKLWVVNFQGMFFRHKKPISEETFKKSAARWDLGGPISSGYVAHCLHLFFMSILMLFSVFYIYAISEFYDTDFARQVVYKPRVLSVSS